MLQEGLDTEGNSGTFQKQLLPVTGDGPGGQVCLAWGPGAVAARLGRPLPPAQGPCGAWALPPPLHSLCAPGGPAGPSLPGLQGPVTRL